MASILIAFVIGISPIVHAAEITTSGDVRAATSFANTKGWCKVNTDTRTADCGKRTTTCDAKQWSQFISDNVSFIGGGVPQRKTAEERMSQAPNATIASPYAFGSGSAPPGPGELLPDGVYSYLRKDPQNRELIKPLNEAACYCECPNGSTNAACEGKPVGTPYRIGTDLVTREECVALCLKSDNSQVASKCAGALPSLEQVDSGSVEGQQAAIAASQASDALAMCFSQGECTTQKGTWEAWDQCQSGKGRCVAPEPSVQLNTAIGSVTSIQGFGNYIITIFRYMLSIVVFVTTVMFVWGAFRYLVGSSMGSIGRGKEIMKDAVVGMILLLCSVGILRTINPATLKMSQVKIYMVNNQQFIQAMYCKDLSSSERLADAGDLLAPRDRSVVEKNLAAYSVAPSAGECGHAYYLKSSTAGTCEGTVCPNKNEVCVSCASGEPLACLNQKSTKKVCDPQMFAGSINYSDFRYASKVYLVGVCGHAQVNDPYATDANSIASDNIILVDDVDLAKVRQQAGTTGDQSGSGQQMYSFKLSADEIQKAVSSCSGGGNSLRGFLLGVIYYDGFATAGDVALLSKQNCVGGKALLDGYATGGATDKPDIVSSYICGLKKSPPRFLDSSGTYWKKEELDAAVAGRQAISCNFDLSDANAPSSPGDKDPFCPLSAAQQHAVQAAPACADSVKDKGSCDDTVRTCRLGSNMLCTCQTDTSALSSGGINQGGPQTQTARVWSCQ